MSMFGKFNQKAKQVLDISQQSAISLRHRFWGTEHLLVGLLTRAADDLPSLPHNITLESVQDDAPAVLTCHCHPKCWN